MAWPAFSRPGRLGQVRDRQSRCGALRPGGAEAVLRKHGLWDAIRPQLVLGDTIAQAAQFATTGNAMGGLVAYSLVLSPGVAGRGKYAVIPKAITRALRQRMVLLKRAGATATQFYDLPAGRRRARHSSKARIRSATIAGHGLGGPPRFALARRGHDRDSAALRYLVRTAAGACAISVASSLVEALVTVPLVLPPTVLGFYLLVTFGARFAARSCLQALVGQSLPFSFAGLLLASAIANIPFVVQPIQRGFEAIPSDVRDAAACCGLTPWQRFVQIEMPLAWPSILTAAILTFAHTLGEFGVVLMVGGNLPGRDAHAQRCHLRSDAGLRRSKRRHHGGDAARDRGRHADADDDALAGVGPRRG